MVGLSVPARLTRVAELYQDQPERDPDPRLKPTARMP